MNESQAHYLLIYTGLVAVAVLIEAIALGALAFATAKLIKQIAVVTDEAKVKVYPILDSVKEIAKRADEITVTAKDALNETVPKIHRITNNFAETSDVYRAKVAEVDSLVSDATLKARRQTERVDDLVTGAITRTGEAASSLQHALMVPVRQISGIVNGTKAGIESLVSQFAPKAKRAGKTPRPVAFEGDSVYTGYEDDYHA
jgi:methyl-accepting chemotaxis protein